MARGGVRVPVAPLLLAALMGVSLPDTSRAADLREAWRERAPPRWRSEVATGCPSEIPVDYHRPRLVEEPPCYAVRPYGLSRRLYDPLVPPEFGTTY